MTERALYAFGEFELEPGERRLTRRGRPVALTPKAFDLLAYLVERAGHLVSKDELMEALWPGRIVLESNLTKHIWYVRRALGDEDSEAGLIQTVSKLGYRFAPVVTRAQATEATARASVIMPSPLRWAAMAGAAVGVAGILAALTFAALTWGPGGAHARPGTAVAVADLRNLSRDPANAWIGPALTEMLATDIAADGNARALPDDLVRPAEAGIAQPVAGGFGRDSLATLRRRLAADYVITGGYLVSGAPGAAILRIDFILQDARSGATVATLSRSGAMSDLPALATGAGADLRRDLAGGRAAPSLEAGAEPSTTDVMRHMGAGLDALHRYDAVHARDEFLEAVAEDPSYAPAYADLAQAWSALGYRARALAAAEQALALSAHLPTPQRLQIVVQQQEARFDWPGAAASLRQLIALRPKDPEFRLQLIDALLPAGKIAEGEATLASLHGLGGSVQDDPRVELAAGRIAAARADTPAAFAHANRALALARNRDAAALAAEAELQLGIASKSAVGAGFLQKAAADYRALGDPRGEAQALQNLGNAYSDSDPRRARDAYERSLAEYQRIGDLEGVAADYSDLGIMLWNAGDRDSAETAVRHVLEIRRETGDVAGQAWALAALAVQQSDESASDESIANFRRAIALDEAAEARGHMAFTLFSLSDILRLRGELAQAAQICAQAQKLYGGQANLPSRAPADFECAQISLDIGDLAATEAALKRALAEAQSAADVMTMANVDLLQGQIDMGLRRWAQAANSLRAADQVSSRAEMVTGQATAASLLALCDAALGHTADRDREAARARALRSRITERQEVIQVDIALAELGGETGDRAAADANLRALAADAARRRWLGWSLEAQLAAARLEADAGGARHRAELAATARKAGYGWVVKRLS